MLFSVHYMTVAFRSPSQLKHPVHDLHETGKPAFYYGGGERFMRHHCSLMIYRYVMAVRGEETFSSVVQSLVRSS